MTAGHGEGSRFPKSGCCSKIDRWRRSPEFRAIANRALANFNAGRHKLPKCGARRHYDGQPCQMLALENGRCKFHGGRVPKGDQWHRLQLPKKGASRGVEKFDKKMEAAEQRERRKHARLGMMTPEQRDRHIEWHRTHKPKSNRERAQTRQDRSTRAWLGKLLAGPSAAPARPPATSPASGLPPISLDDIFG